MPALACVQASVDSCRQKDYLYLGQLQQVNGPAAKVARLGVANMFLHPATARFVGKSGNPLFWFTRSLLSSPTLVVHGIEPVNRYQSC